MEDPKDLFKRWYVQPLEKLKSISNGDGAFIALSTSCFLYERYAVAVIKQSGEKAEPEKKVKQLMTDFNIDKETAQSFWNVMRNGLLHQGMPTQKKNLPRWRFNAEFIQPIALSKNKGLYELQVQPWLFMDRVVKLWQDNLHLLEQSNSFPWANIV